MSSARPSRTIGNARRTKEVAKDGAEVAGEAAIQGCFGCSVDLVIGLTIVAAIPLLL